MLLSLILGKLDGRHQNAHGNILMKSGLNFSGIIRPLKLTCVWTQMTKTQSGPIFPVHTPAASLMWQCYSTTSMPAPFSDISFLKGGCFVSLWKRVGMIWLRSWKKANEVGGCSMCWSKEATAWWKSLGTTLANGSVPWPCSSLTVPARTVCAVLSHLTGSFPCNATSRPSFRVMYLHGAETLNLGSSPFAMLNFTIFFMTSLPAEMASLNRHRDLLRVIESLVKENARFLLGLSLTIPQE